MRKAGRQSRVALKQQLYFDRFPTSCALLVGGVTLLPKPLLSAYDTLVGQGNERQPTNSRKKLAMITFATSFVTAALGFALMNLRASKAEKFQQRLVEDQDLRTELVDQPRPASEVLTTATPAPDLAILQSIPLAGKTLDLTLFALVRALDIGVRKGWSNLGTSQRHGSIRTRLSLWVERLASPAIFASSSAIIMWAWFYQPHRLPRSYSRWITSVAQVDSRLVRALQECRFGNFVYGRDTGMAPLLQSLCRDLGLPEAWGDPAITVPVPCELYHSGLSASCELHAAKRFMHAYQFAMQLNLPLNLLLAARKQSSRSVRGVYSALLDADRSSAFLGAFVALFYYGVCLARTRLGPKVFSAQTVTPTMWDSGLCVAAGCALCGWSALWETPSRRRELASFVAPRAMGTVLPRRYDRKNMWREQVVFSLSVATVLTTATVEPTQIKGVFGAILARVLE